MIIVRVIYSNSKKVGHLITCLKEKREVEAKSLSLEEEFHELYNTEEWCMIRF